MMSSELEKFEEILIKVQSGETLSQALIGCTKVKSSKAEALRWHSIKSDILDGKVSCLAALSSYIEVLRKEKRLKMLWKRKSQGPLIQAYAILLSGILFFIASLSIFPNEMKPDLYLSCFYLITNTIGFYWMKHFMKDWKSIVKESDWLNVLNEFKHGLLSGYTFQSIYRRISLKQSIQIIIGKKCPSIIKEQWSCLLRLDEEGRPLSSFLISSIEQYQNYYENKIEEESEKLQFKLLLPILFCQLPAQLTLIFLPLIQNMSRMI